MQNFQPSIKALSIWTYVFSLLLWLSLCCSAIAIVILLNIRDVKKELTQYGDAYSNHLNKEMVSSETILKGFAALFSAVGNTEPSKASRYVNQVIESNPHIFALEIVQKITKNQLSEFVAIKRSQGAENFSVKSFSYDSDRKWHALQEKAYYYPIIFMEPMRSGSEDVLGLDIESVPFLRQAMTESIQKRKPVASHPFRLVEGNLAYVVFYPISPAFKKSDSPLALNTQNNLVVNMVIDAANLVLPAKFPAVDGQTVIIYHKEFDHNDANGQLLSMSSIPRSTLETKIFPVFTYKKSLATMDEPFSLMVSRQVGCSDLSLELLSLMTFLSLLSSLIIIAYLNSTQQNRRLQIENQKKLWMLANYDHLTGLPNRMLLQDRLNQMLARAVRQKTSFAVIFLDINDFKKINDTYGHNAGDQLLKFVAENLQTEMRANDTVARLSGDEFIILIEDVENPEELNAVRQKIQQKLYTGYQIKDRHTYVQVSIGTAIFPDDGDTPETLIKQADIKMYANKKNKKVKLHLV